MASAVQGVDQDRYLNAIAEIVTSLIKAYEMQIPVNISRLKTEAAKKHRCSCIHMGAFT